MMISRRWVEQDACSDSNNGTNHWYSASLRPTSLKSISIEKDSNRRHFERMSVISKWRIVNHFEVHDEWTRLTKGVFVVIDLDIHPDLLQSRTDEIEILRIYVQILVENLVPTDAGTIQC